MTIGMLWLCNSKESLEKNIELAADAYRKKCGKPAEICLINVSSLPEGKPFTTGDVMVKPFKSIPALHLWIGREDETLLEQATGDAQ